MTKTQGWNYNFTSGMKLLLYLKDETITLPHGWNDNLNSEMKFWDETNYNSEWNIVNLISFHTPSFILDILVNQTI